MRALSKTVVSIAVLSLLSRKICLIFSRSPNPAMRGSAELELLALAGSAAGAAGAAGGLD
jgi:hypothetical protein